VPDWLGDSPVVLFTAQKVDTLGCPMSGRLTRVLTDRAWRVSLWSGVFLGAEAIHHKNEQNQFAYVPLSF